MFALPLQLIFWVYSSFVTSVFFLLIQEPGLGEDTSSTAPVCIVVSIDEKIRKYQVEVGIKQDYDQEEKLTKNLKLKQLPIQESKYERKLTGKD